MTRYAIPTPPPVIVTQVWTAQGFRADRCTAHADCWLLEPGTALSHYRWEALLSFGSPLSDTPPEGNTMTLADIAARCHSDALSLREAATDALREAATDATVVGNGKIAQQAIDRANTVDALAILLDRLARVPMANSYPPYVDAAQRLARLAGVNL